MAVVKYSSIIESMSGRIGNVVHYRRLGTDCVRSYVVPRNPDTEAQKTVRRSFRDAVRSWQAMPQEEKYRFNRKARCMNMSGYNLYISGFMNERISALKMNSSNTYSPVQAVLSSHLLRFPSVSAPNQSRTGGRMQIKQPDMGFAELLL
ncbi:MAG: hypothetical protein JXN64_10240 [Spirochaetes bacterium]|nr:hypothetical protein [Spirochaetota bacterium]